MPDKALVGEQESQLIGRKGVRTVEVAVGACAIHSVVVYSDRAEVKRTVPASLAAGENEVLLTGLTECVDKNSIRVEGQGAAVITDVIYSSDTSEAGKGVASSGSKEEYEGLRAEIREREGELRRLRFKEEVLGQQRMLLRKFAGHVSKGQSGKGDGDSVGVLVEGERVACVLEFFERYEEKVASLDERTMEVQQNIRQLKEKIKALKANAEKINPEAKVVSKETIRSLRVGLEAREATDVTLVLSYVVSNASWASAYDVRVFSKNKAMKVQYYGLIKQATGEDWENANISLSTAQPSIGGSAPSLPARLIRFKRPRPMLMYPGLVGLGSGGQERFRSITRTLGDQLESLEMRSESLALNGSTFAKSASKAKGGFGFGGGTSRYRRSSYSPPPSPPALDIDVAKVSSGLFNTTYAIPRTTSIPADATIFLSCLGSILVLLTYLLLKDMRTGAQRVITMLAIADFFTAFGYIIGAANFLAYFNVMDDQRCVMFGTICSIQSFITTWSTMCSYCWTCILAFYFFVVIVFNKVHLAARLMPAYNIIAWIGPLLIIFPLLVLGKLGYAPYVASNWCYIKDTNYSSSLRKSWDMIVYILIAGKLWEVLTYIFIMTLYIVIRIRITKTHKKLISPGPHVQLGPRVVQVEKQLLAIPLLYILLRMWGTLQFFYSLGVAGTNHNGCIPKTVQIVFLVFGILQAIGDGAQGWCNAILYVFLSPKIRRRLFGQPLGKCLMAVGDKIAQFIDSATTTPLFQNSLTSQPELESARTVEIENNAVAKTSSETESIPIRKAVGYKITRYTTTTTEATRVPMCSASVGTSGLGTGGQKQSFQASWKSIRSNPLNDATQV